MSRTGDLATLRFFFAKKQVDECNGDFSPTICEIGSVV
jgi:hypothetical protein